MIYAASALLMVVVAFVAYRLGTATKAAEMRERHQALTQEVLRLQSELDAISSQPETK